MAAEQRGAERPTAEELAEWRAKADAATEGPWEWRRDEPASLVCEHRISGFRVRVLKAPAWGPTMADAEFIATARSAVPRLLDEVERLRETVARLNRRAQIAESAINDLTREPIGGREHAPVAAEVWARCEETHGLVCRAAREARAEVSSLRDMHRGGSR